MRKRILPILLALALLTGCSRADYIENQVYGVILGVDAENGGMRLVMRAPKLAGEDESGYLTVAAEGGSFQQALDSLRMGAGRRVNLSALVLIVVSEEIAGREDLVEIMRTLISNDRVFSAVYFAVCQGKAGDFVRAHRPTVGRRMSEGLTALVENNAEVGYIPESRLADVYYRTVSACSDPLVMGCAILEDGNGQENGGDVSARELPVENETGNAYLGSYVLRDGKVAAKLTGLQTLLVNVLRGSVKKFTYASESGAVSLETDGRPEIRIDTDGERLRLDVRLCFQTTNADGEADLQSICRELRDELQTTLRQCKIAGVEPFGFADRAALRFATTREFLRYDWRMRFSEAEITVETELEGFEMRY